MKLGGGEGQLRGIAVRPAWHGRGVSDELLAIDKLERSNEDVVDVLGGLDVDHINESTGKTQVHRSR